MKAKQRPPILKTSIAALAALLICGAATAKAQTLVWTGATNNLWEVNTNWNPAGTPNTSPDPSLIFTGSRNTISDNNNFGGTFIQNITFDQNAAAFQLVDQAIYTFGGSAIVNNSRFAQILNFVDAFGIGVGGIGIFSFNGETTTISANTAPIIINSSIAFDTPGSLVFNGASTTIVNGPIYDAGTPPNFGTVTIAGPGMVIFFNHNTYPGATYVTGGTLNLVGSIASQNTIVTGGTLMGTGILYGNLQALGGNVAPGEAHGTLTVTNNYYQSNAGTLTVAVDGTKPGQYSALLVGGHAFLGGDLRIVSTGQAPRLSVGQKVNVLVAEQGVVGQFGKVDAPPLEKVIYKTNSVDVEQSSYTSVANLTPNEIAVAKALDKLSTGGSHSNLIGFLQSESLKDLPGDYARISPDQLTSIFQLDVSLADVQSANLQRRMEDIRYGSHGFSASGFATAGSGPMYSGGLGSAGPSGNDGKESKEMKEVAPVEDRWGVFITGVGEWVNVTGDNNARGYDMTTGGFTLGADYKVTPNFAVGIDAGYAGTATDLTDHGRVFVNGGKLGLYSTYFTGGFYLDTAASGGYNSYDIRRAALGGTARSDADGGEFNLLVATGYDFKVGGFTFGPTASFQYGYTGLTSFGETGSLAPLNFPGQYQDSLRTAFGAKASYDCKFGGVTFRPELSLAWQHEYGDNTFAIDSTMDGAGDLFRTTGPRIGRDSLLVGAGFAILWNERTSTYLYYDGELARTRYDENSVSGGVRVSF